MYHSVFTGTINVAYKINMSSTWKRLEYSEEEFYKDEEFIQYDDIYYTSDTNMMIFRWDENDKMFIIIRDNNAYDLYYPDLHMDERVGNDSKLIKLATEITSGHSRSLTEEERFIKRTVLRTKRNINNYIKFLKEI